MAKLILLRSIYTGISTAGVYLVNEKHLAYSLEDAVRPDRIKIYGRTAIWPGIYQIKVDYSPKFKRDLPHIINVPRFTGIRIHGGNEVEDSAGCPLIGKERRGDSSIGNCRNVLNHLCRILRESGDHTIEVINSGATI